MPTPPSLPTDARRVQACPTLGAGDVDRLRAFAAAGRYAAGERIVRALILRRIGLLESGELARCPAPAEPLEPDKLYALAVGVGAAALATAIYAGEREFDTWPA